MIRFIRNSKYAKFIAAFLAFNFLVQVFNPMQVMALTGGPSQPEVQSFEPVGTSEMVDLFSGNFTYNIPLMDVGGYPLNLSYHSGITMDQEASWVGLGWNINPGVINRNMRGLPDDFNGDNVTKQMNLKPNNTGGGSLGLGAELFGSNFLNAHFSYGLSVNNYVGVSLNVSHHISASLGILAKGLKNGGVGITTSNQSGLTISPKLSLEGAIKSTEDASIYGGLSCGISYNSRQGLSSVSIGSSLSGSVDKTIERQNKQNRQFASSKEIAAGSNISFVPNTYTPNIQMPMCNESYEVSLELGPTFFTADVTGDAHGYWSSHKLASKSVTSPAYGYMYSQNGYTNSSSLLDFNREKDGPYTVNTPALPVTNFTYDIYSASGQGINAMFRPYRGDFGYVYDQLATNTGQSSNLGMEAGLGNIAKGGFETTSVSVNTTTSAWISDNMMVNQLKFYGELKSSDADNSYEPYYFKQVGDRSVDPNRGLLKNIGGFNPVAAKIVAGGGYYSKADNYWVNDDRVEGAYTKQYRQERMPRNQAVSVVYKKDYKNLALDASLYDDVYVKTSSEIGSSDHVAEVTVTKPDGSRYVYGLPAYNIKQKEVSFNVSGRSFDCTTGLVTYNPSEGDNSTNNKRGVDHFYTGTEIPPYAHSYMLTAVLSADYVDLTGDGPSKDDLGTYTKFNYIKVEDYEWRTPYEQNAASFDERLKTVQGEKGDDQGSYVYGQKDLWFLKNIETKNHVAQFNSTNDRNDGLGVLDENGGQDQSTQLRKLNSIGLYSKSDDVTYNAVTKTFDCSSATPIKTVHFKYADPSTETELCEGIPNSLNNGGKLTLKQVYFTYGNSNKARFSPYVFDYKESDITSDYNPDYDQKAYDRWGNYKPVNEYASCNYYFELPGGGTTSGGLTNGEFPYVDQYNDKADIHASVWNLREISLPSGGVITVDYEADDYAYVQDKRAMQMFMLSDVSDNDNLDSDQFDDIAKDNISVYYKLQAEDFSYINEHNAEKFKDQCLEGIDKMYFRVMAQVNHSNVNNGYEYVSGYADIDHTGTDLYPASGSPTHLEIKLKDLDFGGTSLNPISYAALQFGRIHTSDLVYDNAIELEDIGDYVKLVKDVTTGGLIDNILEAFLGQELYLYQIKNIGTSVNIDKSWVRLNNPAKKKLGGGARVSKIQLADGWNSQMGEAGFEDDSYGQEYSYTTYDENGDRISSGVAAYEPMVGGDENPFKMPFAKDVDDLEKPFLGPDDRSYLEEPFGESFFPAPSVGYSAVTVKSLSPDPLETYSITRHASGKTVHEFYTAKDYPTRTHRTDLNLSEQRSSFYLKLFKYKIRDYVNVSQGYVVELNDMHGKPKANLVYAENSDSPISGVRYYYKDNGIVENTSEGKQIRKSGNRLVNEFAVIDNFGVKKTKMVGVDYDFINDARQQKTDVIHSGSQINNYGVWAFFFPAYLPSIKVAFSEENTRFRSMVSTKVIQRYGILDETVSFSQGENSKISQKILALDEQTGDVLLTQTTNEYNDKFYSFTYPAHWVYDGMGPSYKNTGIDRYNVYIASNNISNGINNYDLFNDVNSDILVHGNEVIVIGSNGSYTYETEVSQEEYSRFWLFKKDASTFQLLTRYGDNPEIEIPEIPDGNYTLKVIRSARRNQHNIPVATFTSKVSPITVNIDGDTIISDVLNKDFEILDAGVTEYSDQWRTFDCRYGIASDNPFVNGKEGIWRFKKAHRYITEREQDNQYLRSDGYYKFFEPFWIEDGSGNWVENTSTSAPNGYWDWQTEVTDYSPYGHEIENKNKLDIYSSALYRYNSTLPIAVGYNAHYQDIAYDGFEDYSWDACWAPQGHFNFNTGIIENIISGDEAHTGRYSLKVAPGDTIAISRTLSGCN